MSERLSPMSEQSAFATDLRILTGSYNTGDRLELLELTETEFNKYGQKIERVDQELTHLDELITSINDLLIDLNIDERLTFQDARNPVQMLTDRWKAANRIRARLNERFRP